MSAGNFKKCPGLGSSHIIFTAPQFDCTRIKYISEMAKEATGIAVGLNKGHVVARREPRAKPSSNKGKVSKRVQLIRKVVREVSGLAPYEKRVLELIKGGGANGPKRATRFLKRRLGSLKRAKRKFGELSDMS